MKYKLPRITLAALGLQATIALTAFGNEAPVVDIQDQPQANGGAVPQSAQPSSGGWQEVSNNAASGSDSSTDSAGNKSAPKVEKSSNNNSDPSAGGDDGAWQPATERTREAPVSSGSNDQRIARLEQQISNYNQMNLPQQVSDLQQKISQLQGQVETDQHTIKTLTDQQKRYYQDTQQQLAEMQQSPKSNKATSVAANIDASSAQNTSDNLTTTGQTEFESKTSRTSTIVAHKKKGQSLKTVAQNPNPPGVTPEGQEAGATAVAKSQDIVDGQNLLAKNGTKLSDADLYDKAFKSLSNKDFKAAQSGFQDYLSNYPKGKFAVSAHFWLGEIGLMHEKYDAALKQFQTVVSNYPSSNKVPDAKLKIAMIHAATGKMDVARQEFGDIRKAYPGTTAAQLASIRLQQLANVTSTSVQ